MIGEPNTLLQAFYYWSRQEGDKPLADTVKLIPYTLKPLSESESEGMKEGKRQRERERQSVKGKREIKRGRKRVSRTVGRDRCYHQGGTTRGSAGI